MIKKLAATLMAGVMLLGTGMVACAEETTYTGARFYANYDINDDDVIDTDEWGVAPYNMDDGNIVSVSQSGTEITITFGVGTYSITMGSLGTVDMTGYISELAFTNTGAVLSTRSDSSYSPSMVAEVVLDTTQVAYLDGMPGYYATLTAKKNVGKLGMTPPGNMGTAMTVFLALEN